MARGKYANKAEAREARETAIQEAARLRHENAKLESRNTELQAQIEELRLALAAGVTAELTATQARAESLEADLKHARSLIADTREAIKSTYEGTIRGLMKMGLPLDVAADRVDEVTTFLVGDELLPYTEVTVAFAVNKGQVQKIRKRNRAERNLTGTANRVAKINDRNAYARLSQGVGE